MKNAVIILSIVVFVVMGVFIVSNPKRIDGTANDLQHVLQTYLGLQSKHPTYFVVVYVAGGHVPATQGQLTEVGQDYFCVFHSPSKECFALDKVASLDFFEGK